MTRRSVWRVLANDAAEFIGGTFAVGATVSAVVWLMWLCITHPRIGLPGTAAVLLLVWIASALDRAK